MNTTAKNIYTHRFSKAFFFIGGGIFLIAVVSVTFMWRKFFVETFFEDIVAPVLWLLFLGELIINIFLGHRESSDQAPSFTVNASLLFLAVGIAVVWWFIAQIMLYHHAQGLYSQNMSVWEATTFLCLKCLCVAATGLGAVGLLRIKRVSFAWRSVFALSLTLVVLSMYMLSFFNSIVFDGFTSWHPKFTYFAILTIIGLLSSVISLLQQRRRVD